MYSVHLAVRGFARSRKVLLLAVATIALGLAACMTTMTLIHVLSADPLPGVSESLYLGWVDTANVSTRRKSLPSGVSLSEPSRMLMVDALALAGDRSPFPATALGSASTDVVDADGIRKLKSQSVLLATSKFAKIFGLQLAHGRFWSISEDASRAPVALIDTDAADRLFGKGDPIGRTVQLGEGRFRVIGVFQPLRAEPHFYDMDAWVFDPDRRESVVVPLTAGVDAALRPGSNDGCLPASGDAPGGVALATDTSRCAWVSVWASIPEGPGRHQYKAYLEAFAHMRSGEPMGVPASSMYSAREWLIRRNAVPDNVRLNGWLACSFLLLCVANMAGLLTAKFLRGGREIGVRRALGAPKWSVFCQHMAESWLLCLVGGVVAIPLTVAGLWIIRKQSADYAHLAHLDLTMFGALLVLVLLVGSVVGLIPAWRSTRIDPSQQIRRS